MNNETIPTCRINYSFLTFTSVKGIQKTERIDSTYISKQTLTLSRKAHIHNDGNPANHIYSIFPNVFTPLDKDNEDGINNRRMTEVMFTQHLCKAIKKHINSERLSFNYMLTLTQRTSAQYTAKLGPASAILQYTSWIDFIGYSPELSIFLTQRIDFRANSPEQALLDTLDWLIKTDRIPKRRPIGLVLFPQKAWKRIMEAIGPGFTEANICNEEFFSLSNLDRKILSSYIQITYELPSSFFDDDGTFGKRLNLVIDGVLRQHLLSTSQATRIGGPSGVGVMHDRFNNITFDYSYLDIQSNRRCRHSEFDTIIETVKSAEVNFSDFTCKLSLIHAIDEKQYMWSGTIDLYGLFQNMQMVSDESVAIFNMQSTWTD